MLIDNELYFANHLAFGGTPEVIDLGGDDKGPGKPIHCFFTTEAALTGATGLVVTDGATSAAADALMILTIPIAVVGLYEFYLPSSVNRYVTIALQGTVSAGTFSAGVIMDAQSSV